MGKLNTAALARAAAGAAWGPLAVICSIVVSLAVATLSWPLTSSRVWVMPRSLITGSNTNGDVASHLIVSSAGFLSVQVQVGAPRIFLSHGLRDAQIPIDRSARIHAARLREAGYDLTYVEYDGPHAYDAGVVGRAVDFFLAESP